MLELLNIDGKEIDLIADLYWSQQACVNIDGTFSEWFTVERGLRQGCNLSHARPGSTGSINEEESAA